MLKLADLCEGDIRAISPALGTALAEAAAVCLELNSHNQGVRIKVRGHKTNSYKVTWPPATPQSFLSWNDHDHATEWGAVGVAILIAKMEIGFEIIRQSRKGTGFDYWMGNSSDAGFEEKAGLEVSGILNGDDRSVQARVRKKIKQTSNSERSDLEFYVVVVEFGRPIAEIQ